jgi:hypothetical protein
MTLCERRCYEQLVLVEKEVGFDTLYKLKNELFVFSPDTVHSFLEPVQISASKQIRSAV